MKQRRVVEARWRLAAWGAWAESGLVLTTRLGDPFDPRNLHRYFKARAAKAGVPVISVHATRRTCASLLVALDVLHGLAGGVSNHHEVGIRQQVTPDALLGRVNATMRSANRTVAALGALLGGASVGLLGGTTTAVLVAAVFLVAVTLTGLSPLREVRSLDAV